MPNAADLKSTVAAAVALSVLGVAGFLVMPLLVAGAVQSLHYNDRELGILSSLLLLGSTVSAIAAGVWVRRVHWRWAAAISVLGGLITSAVCIRWHAMGIFLSAQCLAGFFGGALYSLALTVLADGSHPDRSFGFSLAAQVAFQVAGLWAGPRLLHAGGIDAILAVFAVLSIVGLALVPALPARGREIVSRGIGSGRLWTLPVICALAGCFLFFLNVNCYWTYVEPIGTAAGLASQVIANDLALGVAVGIGGALLASWWGERYGRTGPIGIAALLIVVAVLMLPYASRSAAFLLSTAVYNFAWNYSLAYQYAAVNAVDDSGRGVAIAPAFHSGGGAAGPAVAALSVTAGNYHGVYWITTAAVLLSFVAFALSAASRRRSNVPARI
jgi:MFS family permease